MQTDVESTTTFLCLVIFLCSVLCFSNSVEPSIVKDSTVPKNTHTIVHPSWFENVENQAVSVATLRNISSALPSSRVHASYQPAHLHSALAERIPFSKFLWRGHRLIWKTYRVVVNSTEAVEAYEKMYKQLQQTVGELLLNDSLVFTGQIVVVFGALELRFDGFPQDLQQARDIMLQFLFGMSALLARSLILAVYHLIVYAYDTIFQFWLSIGE